MEGKGVTVPTEQNPVYSEHKFRLWAGGCKTQSVAV